MGYFMPLADEFMADLKAQDRRSAKEWEYLNSAEVWAGLGLMVLEVESSEKGSIEEMERRL